MNKSHFDKHLLPNENILWAGQPDEITFHKEELRLGSFIMWLILAWSIAYGVRMIWQHGLLHSHPLGWLILTGSGLVAAILLKLMITFSRSNARYYWYAVTDARVLAEIPDEGSHSIISINLSDVYKLSIKHEKINNEKSDIGSITLTTNTQRNKTLCLKYIKNAEAIYNILEKSTHLAANVAPYY